MEIRIINKSNNKLPERATIGSSGYDLISNENISIPGFSWKLIDTGISVCILNSQYELQIRSRSGLALKYGITVLNSPGTIDSDYTGNIKVILMNNNKFAFKISIGDKIAQMILAKTYHIDFIETTNLKQTLRNKKGFGSTDDIQL